MDAEAAKLIGAGIAALGMGLAAIAWAPSSATSSRVRSATRRLPTRSSVAPSSAPLSRKAWASSPSSWR